MRRYPDRAAALAATFATAGLAVLIGCSPGTDGEPATTSPPTPTDSAAESSGSVTGVSPSGVTTSVAAPAESTEDEYFQACQAARVWMEQQSDDLKAQIEPYLATLQSSDAPGPSTFDTPWSHLSPARQAAVIVAVQAAADRACG